MSVRGVARAVLPLVPLRLRQRILRARLLAPARRWFLSENPAWWDRFYADFDVDAYASDPAERHKGALSVRAVSDVPHARILEIGCGVGVVGQALAPVCDAYVGVDPSPVAVRLANRRLVDFEHARAVVGRLPDQLPAGPFDVVLCADVLFYLTARELDAAVGAIMTRLHPDGVLVALHHRKDIGLPMRGDDVHRRLRNAPGLRHAGDLGDELMAVDRFRLDDPIPASQPPT